MNSAVSDIRASPLNIEGNLGFQWPAGRPRVCPGDLHFSGQNISYIFIDLFFNYIIFILFATKCKFFCNQMFYLLQNPAKSFATNFNFRCIHKLIGLNKIGWKISRWVNLWNKQLIYLAIFFWSFSVFFSGKLRIFTIDFYCQHKYSLSLSIVA